MKHLLLVLIFAGALPSHAEGARACDAFIAQYCADGADHGPGCLRGHEADVSAECLSDMERQGPPHQGQPPQGPPPGAAR